MFLFLWLGVSVNHDIIQDYFLWIPHFPHECLTVCSSPLCLRSRTWTHSPLETRCIQTCGTISNRSVLLKIFIVTYVLCINSPDISRWVSECKKIPSTLCLLAGGSKHTRYANSWHCPQHHEPLDSPDGLPSRHRWHQYRNYQPKTFPVGSRVCSGPAL